MDEAGAHARLSSVRGIMFVDCSSDVAALLGLHAGLRIQRDAHDQLESLLVPDRLAGGHNLP